MSEIRREVLSKPACAMAKVAVFPFLPSNGNGGGVTLATVEEVPPTDGAFFAFQGHLLTMHMGRPLALRQRREDMSHEWTLSHGDMSLIPAGWRTTVWSETPTNFLQVELCPEFVRSAAGSADAVDLPCLFSFDDPVCRELSLSMVAEAQAHGTGRAHVRRVGRGRAGATAPVAGPPARGAGAEAGPVAGRPAPRQGVPPRPDESQPRRHRAVGGGRDERRSLLSHVQAVDRPGAPPVPGQHPPRARQAAARRRARLDHRDRVRDRLHESESVLGVLPQAHGAVAHGVPAKRV